MKVVCGECAAKYQIPDERVAGRRLKIRCRKCGGVMEARGDDPAAFVDAAFKDVHGELLSRAIAPSLVPPAPSNAGPEWFVSVDGAPAGPLNTGDLVTRVATGVVDWDAHVWRDGYAAWITVGDSDTLVRAVAEMRSMGSDMSNGTRADSTERTTTPTHEQRDQLDEEAEPTFATRSVDSEDAPTHSTLDDSPTRISYDETPTRTYSQSAPTGVHSSAGSPQLQQLARAAFASRPPGSLAAVSAPSRQHAAYASQAQQEAAYVSRSPSYAPVHALAPLPPITSPASAPPVFSALAQALPITASRNGGAAIPPPRAGFAGGEGSGIIDIRALASLAQSHYKAPAAPQFQTPQSSLQSSLQLSHYAAASHAPAPQAYAPQGQELAQRPDPTEPFATIGANHGVAFAALDSIAPVSRKARPKDATVPFAILTGAAMIAAAAFAALYVTRVPAASVNAPIAAAAQPIAALAAPIQAPAVAEAPAAQPTDLAPTPTEAQAEAVAPEPGAIAAQVDEVDEVDEVEEVAEPEEPATAAPRTGGKARAGRGRAPAVAKSAKAAKSEKAEPEAEKAAKSEHAAAPPPTLDDVLLADDGDDKAKAKAEPAVDEPVVATKSKAPAGPDTRSIDDLLSGAVAPGATHAAKPAAAALPEAPSRDDVLSAMRSIEGEVRACGASEAEPVTGTANVALTVVGSTGRVKNAEVTGIQGAVGSCIARLARKVTFSPFSRATFSVNYPYRFK